MTVINSMMFSSPDASSTTAKAEFNVDSAKDELDNFVADALKQMSLEEREQVYFGQHGVSDKLEEDPDLVAQRLDEMESHLRYHKGRNDGTSAAYELAESLSPSFVNDFCFRQRFLAADGNDTKKAALRFCRYFDFKRSLFGDEKLGKKITMDDLSPEEIKAMKKGFFQMLPFRDRSDRLVIVFFPTHQDGTPSINLVSTVAPF